MSSSLTRMTAFWPPDDPLVLSRMALEGRASRFHCCLANGRLRRISLVAGRPGESPLTEPIAAAQPRRQEPLFMPLCGRSRELSGSVREIGLRTFGFATAGRHAER